MAERAHGSQPRKTRARLRRRGRASPEGQGRAHSLAQPRRRRASPLARSLEVERDAAMRAEAVRLSRARVGLTENDAGEGPNHMQL
eukprot:1120198-Pyramimonas_sp.AAC.1